MSDTSHKPFNVTRRSRFIAHEQKSGPARFVSMTTTSLPVLINREGGAAARAGGKLPDQVSQAFAAVGEKADVQMLAAWQMKQAIENVAQNHKRIVVAGGDGTIASAAQLLTNSGTELAILPFGTLNHFARDLGIPFDLAEAIELAISGDARPVDVGEVNGRRFINNTSIGLYPFMVRNRDDIRERRGWPKWLAMVPASWAALSRLRHHRLRIDMGRGEERVITPLLFVGNNHYSLESGSVGCRDSLSDGKLSVYAVSRAGRLALFWFGARALIGMADREQDFETLGDTAELSVRSRERSLEIALDGEVQRLQLPLDFGIHPGGLNVVLPPDTGCGDPVL
jgi:diacylglycerol kinase family enzyme